MKDVDAFRYQGSYISKDWATKKEISSRIGKAATVFRAQDKVWRSTTYQTQTKVPVDICN